MTWECVHEDLGGPTTRPLNVQAACEQSFEDRPIVARELTPNEPFSWRCFSLPAVSNSGPPDAATEEQLELRRQRLRQEFEGTFDLRIPTTRTGAALVGKLAASGRSYRRKHPHGNRPPSARLRLTISFQRAAATDGKRLQVSRLLSIVD